MGIERAFVIAHNLYQHLASFRFGFFSILGKFRYTPAGSVVHLGVTLVSFDLLDMDRGTNIRKSKDVLLLPISRCIRYIFNLV